MNSKKINLPLFRLMVLCVLFIFLIQAGCVNEPNLPLAQKEVFNRNALIGAWYRKIQPDPKFQDYQYLDLHADSGGWVSFVNLNLEDPCLRPKLTKRIQRWNLKANVVWVEYDVLDSSAGIMENKDRDYWMLDNLTDTLFQAKFMLDNDQGVEPFALEFRKGTSLSRCL